MSILLIVTADDDATTDFLMPALAAEGLEVARWDPGAVPTHSLASLHWDLDGHGLGGRLSGSFGTLELQDVGCVYYRRPSRAHARPDAAESIREFVNAECAAFVRGLLSAIPAETVCHPARAGRADVKPLQHEAAERVGLRVPRTLYSNDPSVILGFLHSLDGPAILKSIHTPGAVNSVGEYRGLYTRDVHADDIDIVAAAQVVSIYQEKIPKAHELRVTVVGQEVHAVAIDASASPLGRSDWRVYDMVNTKHWIADLPATITRACRDLVEGFGLHYGAIDLVVTPSGEYYFLEINAFGQWAWLEQITGIPLRAAHVRLFRRLMRTNGRVMPAQPARN